jgi:hypothetical protein
LYILRDSGQKTNESFDRIANIKFRFSNLERKKNAKYTKKIVLESDSKVYST